jgi:hypothetical protein
MDRTADECIGGVWIDEDGGPRGLRLGDRIGDISHLIADHLAPVWIRELSIGDEQGDLPECGVDPHAPVSIVWPADLYSRCAQVVGNDPTPQGLDATQPRALEIAFG